MNNISGKVAIVGAAESDKIGIVPDKSVLQLHAEAAHNALSEAGLTTRDVDAVFTAGTSPMEGKDASTGTPIKDPRAAAEVWLKGEAIKPYASLAVMMAALREAESSGRIVNAAYVFDYSTGLKLFAHRAFYVAGGSGRAVSASLVAFAWKEEADAFATKHGGRVLSLEDAKKLGAAR